MDCLILLRSKFIESGDAILKYYIALGSNLGEREKFLKSAMDEIAKIGVIEKKSAIYESEPVGFRDQQKYLNALCTLIYDNDAFSLLKKLKLIEKDLGRKKTIHWGPRIIDLDIIDCDGEIIETESLIIPHPEMHNRNFVMIPLAEIESNYKDRNGQNIEQLLKACPSGFIELYSEQW